MLKLLKYEFRRSRTAMLTLIGIIVLLEVFFVVSLEMNREDLMALGIGLLGLASLAALAFILIRGVTSFSSEMKSKSAYLLFMTPNSGMKIMASKYIYTFFNGLLLCCLCGVLVVGDYMMVMSERLDLKLMLHYLDKTLAEYGISVNQLLLYAAFYLMMVLLSILSFCAVAYFATTLSHTCFRDKKWRGFASVLIFLLVYAGLMQLQSLLPDPLLQVMEPTYLSETAVPVPVSDLSALMRFMVPRLALEGAEVILSLLGCGWMLNKKVSL